MERQNHQPETKNQKLRPFSMERLPTGEKIMRIRGRIRGRKLDEKLTLAEIEMLFKEA